jgi:hypothetical protein
MTLGKFIRNMGEPLISNCISHIIMALLLTFPLVHMPPTFRPVTPSTPSFILMVHRNYKPRRLNDGTSRTCPSHVAREARAQGKVLERKEN